MYRIILLLLIGFNLFGCSEENYLFIQISNGSSVDTLVVAEVRLNGESIFKQKLDYSGYVPDMRYSIKHPISKGSNLIEVDINNGELIREYTLVTNKSVWFEIGYSYEPRNWLEIYRNLDYPQEVAKELAKAEGEDLPDVYFIEFDEPPIFY